jgi:hypothetical protein
VGFEIPVSWRRLFSGGESRVKASGTAMTPRPRSYYSPLWEINFSDLEE